MEKTYKINELVDEINYRVRGGELPKTEDGRRKEAVTARRIRDYAAKRLINKPARVGKEAIYNEEHVTQILALRKMQTEGLTDNFIKNNVDLSNTGDLTTYVNDSNDLPQKEDIKFNDFSPANLNFDAASLMMSTSEPAQDNYRAGALGAINNISNRLSFSAPIKNTMLRSLTSSKPVTASKGVDYKQFNGLKYQSFEGLKYRLFVEDGLNEQEKENILEDIKNKLK